MLDYHINPTPNPLQNVGSPWRYPIEIKLDYGAALPYIAQYRKTNAVGRCDESAQIAVQDPLCARALPYQSDKEKSDDRYTLSGARCLDTRCARDAARASSRTRAGGGWHSSW
jgi:hypothetical protein